MKKTSVAKPNLRLKEERELRGWSQKYVADEIGADRYYLSRWEHGTASPSPFYRQKLCAVFGKNARELGLLTDEAGKETAQESLLTGQHAARLKSIEDWSRMLHSIIGQRRLLLVIDDAWRIEAALAFKIGGPHCAYLVTTRFPNIALHFTSGEGNYTRDERENR